MVSCWPHRPGKHSRSGATDWTADVIHWRWRVVPGVQVASSVGAQPEDCRAGVGPDEVDIARLAPLWLALVRGGRVGEGVLHVAQLRTSGKEDQRRAGRNAGEINSLWETSARLALAFWLASPSPPTPLFAPCPTSKPREYAHPCACARPALVAERTLPLQTVMSTAGFE